LLPPNSLCIVLIFFGKMNNYVKTVNNNMM